MELRQSKGKGDKTVIDSIMAIWRLQCKQKPLKLDSNAKFLIGSCIFEL